ncbi:MAG: lipopolysaccharide biosynthesis protein [Gammaproteobacteria bacterium]|nr:MAG: lipopolysaccharide biosynthesis protein [Gammaproteobacteria bacterium]
MSIERQTLTALKWAGLAKLASQLISWAATLVVLRLLHPEDYGLMAIVSVVITVLANIAELGIGAAVVQAPRLDTADLGRVNGLITLSNLSIFLLLLLGAPLVALAFQDPRLTLLVQVAALQMPISSLGALRQALAERELDFAWLARVELGAALVSTVVGLGLALRGAGVWALVGASLAMAVTRSLLLVRRGLIRPSFRLAGVGRFLPVGGSVMFSRLAWHLVSQADVLIGARRLGSEAIGTYSVALHLATLPMQKVMGIINAVALPAVARLQEEPERLRARLLDAMRMMSVISVPVLWGLSATAPELVHVVLGPNWDHAIVPVQLISLIVPLRMIHGIYATTIIGAGHARLNFEATLRGGLILPAAFLAGTFWGVNGLAAAWLAAVPLLFAVDLWLIGHVFRIRAGHVLRAVWRPVLAGLAMYFAVTAARAALAALDEPARLPLLIGAGALAYAVVLYPLDPGVRNDLGTLLRATRSTEPAT